MRAMNCNCLGAGKAGMAPRNGREWGWLVAVGLRGFRRFRGGATADSGVGNGVSADCWSNRQGT